MSLVFTISLSVLSIIIFYKKILIMIISILIMLIIFILSTIFPYGIEVRVNIQKKGIELKKKMHYTIFKYIFYSKLLHI